MLAGRQLLTWAGTNSLHYILQEILVLLRVYFQSHHMDREGNQSCSGVALLTSHNPLFLIQVHNLQESMKSHNVEIVTIVSLLPTSECKMCIFSL